MHLHISHPGTESYLFFNVSAEEAVDSVAKFAYTGTYTIYDAWNNSTVTRSTNDGNIRLRIPARGTLLLRFGAFDGQCVDGLLAAELDDLSWRPMDSNTVFQMSMQNCNEEVWQAPVSISAGQLRNLAPEYPYFAGTIRYTTTISGEDVRYLDLGTVGELAQVTVNGIDCGALVCTPFRFCVADAWKEGDNLVEITIASNCGYRKREVTSRTLPMPPTGLVGPVYMA